MMRPPPTSPIRLVLSLPCSRLPAYLPDLNGSAGTSSSRPKLEAVTAALEGYPGHAHARAGTVLSQFLLLLLLQLHATPRPSTLPTQATFQVFQPSPCIVLLSSSAHTHSWLADDDRPEQHSRRSCCIRQTTSARHAPIVVVRSGPDQKAAKLKT